MWGLRASGLCRVQKVFDIGGVDLRLRGAGFREGFGVSGLRAFWAVQS